MLKPEEIKTPNEDMNKLEDMMNNNSLKKMQVRGYLLQYFNHTGDAKLPAIWLVLTYFMFNNKIVFEALIRLFYSTICLFFSNYILKLLKEGHKFLVFAHHKKVMDGISKVLENNKT